MKSKQSSSSQNSFQPSNKSSQASEKSLKQTDSQRIPLAEVTTAIEQKQKNTQTTSDINNPEEANQVLEFKLNLTLLINQNGKTKEFYNIVLENYLKKQEQPQEFLVKKMHFIIEGKKKKDKMYYDEFQRMRFLDWTIEITQKYSLNYSTFFIIQSILDQFQIITKSITFDNLHLTGLSCIYLASKINDVIPLGIEQIIAISHNMFNGSQIQQKELEIFSVLQFKLNFANSFLFLTLLLRLYLFATQDQNNDAIELSYFTLKLTCFDYKIQIQFTQSEIAAGCFYYAYAIVSMDNKGNQDEKVSAELLLFLEQSIAITNEKLKIVGQKIENLIDNYFDQQDENFLKLKNVKLFNQYQSELLRTYDHKRMKNLL